MSKRKKVLLAIIIFLVCVVRFSSLKNYSESFNTGLDRIEEIKDGVDTVVNDITQDE